MTGAERRHGAAFTGHVVVLSTDAVRLRRVKRENSSYGR
ncbi:hypothetical protein [Azospirillum argentinense]|uniref:Uncharacterized protein n=1 Tax=Azospirillum argentinense TaxID=2970906 RepID=A0A5B0KNY3_9PROT|nr:hypothetical protein FH063_006588 [Azospirillum argentinense]